MVRLATCLGVVMAVGGCGAEPSECENTLVLDAADTGGTHAITDGCTSLVVSLPSDPAVALDAVPVVDAAVLRFDYRSDAAGTTDYYFTPVRSGVSDVQIGAQPATESWTATVTIALPD